MPIPELEPHCGSWIVTDRSDGVVIGEFFSREVVERINTEKYSVETATQYLGKLNSGLAASCALQGKERAPQGTGAGGG